MMYLGSQAVGLNISQNYKVISGTFIGNDTFEYDIACPFMPDVYIVWTDDVTSNPGKEGLLSLAEIRTQRMMSMRYVTSTATTPATGGANLTSGNYYRSYYTNNIMTVSAGGSNTFQFYNGIKYKYIFIKNLIDEQGGDT